MATNWKIIKSSGLIASGKLWQFFTQNVTKTNYVEVKMPLYLLNDCFVMVKCSLIFNKTFLSQPVWPNVLLFFNLWPFTSLKICPSPVITMVKVGTKVCQIPNQNHTKNVPKDVKSLPKWQNIVKSGHTGHSPWERKKEIWLIKVPLLL